MNLTDIDTSTKRGWLALAGLAAVPMYVLPVGIWGVRGLRPRVLRASAQGLIYTGLLSLVTLGAAGLARARAVRPGGLERWKLPKFGPFMSDELAASAASGH